MTRHCLIPLSCLVVVTGCRNTDGDRVAREDPGEQIAVQAEPEVAPTPEIEPEVEPPSDVEPSPELEPARVRIFEQGNHALLDDRLDIRDVLAFTDEEIASAVKMLDDKASPTRGTLHNLAILRFVKRFAHTEARRQDWLRRLDREDPDGGYDADALVAELPIGIDGECVGQGIGSGQPPVQLKPDGTLAGHIESNTTIEEYTGTWKLVNGELIVGFRVVVQETGDSGDTGKPKSYQFEDQKAFVVSRMMLLNADGDACWLRRAP